MELREMVKQARGDRTQAEVAELLGVTTQAVSNWETGANEPSITNLRKLGIELEYILAASNIGREP